MDIDALAGVPDFGGGDYSNNEDSVIRNENALANMRRYKTRTCMVEFENLDEYIFYLRRISEIMEATPRTSSCRPHILYLAAAVSDYYIPFEQMVQHKIQSSSGTLDLHLEAVPKFLAAIKTEWTQSAFVIGFKLETDLDILRQKSQTAMDKYGLDLVVANELNTRYKRIYLLHKSGPWETVEMPVEPPGNSANLPKYLEQLIIARICDIVEAPG